MGGMARAIGTTRTPHAAQHMDAPHTHRTGCSAGGRSREGAAMNLWLSMRCAASKYTDAQRKEVQRRGGVPSAQGQAQGDRPLASRFGAAAAAARRSARGPHAPRSGSRARTAATSDASDASAETSGVCHRAKTILISYLILSPSVRQHPKRSGGAATTGQPPDRLAPARLKPVCRRVRASGRPIRTDLTKGTLCRPRPPHGAAGITRAKSCTSRMSAWRPGRLRQPASSCGRRHETSCWHSHQRVTHAFRSV